MKRNVSWKRSADDPSASIGTTGLTLSGLRIPPSLSVVARRVALVILVALSALAAHQISYLGASGEVAEFGRVMRTTGHDRFWLPLVAMVLAGAGILGVVAIAQLRRLAARSAHLPAAAEEESTVAFAVIALRQWCRIGLSTTVVYGAQEDIERLVAGDQPLGLTALVGHGLLPLVSIAVASLAVALVASLVVWRRRALLARLAIADRSAAWTARPEWPTHDRSSRRSPVVGGGGGSRAPPVPLAA
jgi:hypothetical protein